MMHKVARTGLISFLTLLIAASVPLLAQNQTDKDANSKTSDSKDKNRKDKDKAKHKKKNSDVENIGNRDINKGSINFFSLDKEIAMGRQLAAEIERQVKLNEDPTINEYVNRVGQNLVRNSDAKVPFTIKIVDSNEINAFALPGGFFYVNTGLILAADDESELAGVMARMRSRTLRRATRRSKCRRPQYEQSQRQSEQRQFRSSTVGWPILKPPFHYGTAIRLQSVTASNIMK